MWSYLKFSNLERLSESVLRWLLHSDQPPQGVALSAPLFRWTRLFQVFATAILTAALFILFNLSLMAWRDVSFEPFGEYSVQRVLNKRGADGYPAVSLSKREYVRIEARKCLNQEVFTASSAMWYARDGQQTIRGGSGDLRLRPAGCQTIFYRNTIPSGVTPGLWQIRGVENARATDWFGAVQQSTTWETEWFKIVP